MIIIGWRVAHTSSSCLCGDCVLPAPIPLALPISKSARSFYPHSFAQNANEWATQAFSSYLSAAALAHFASVSWNGYAPRGESTKPCNDAFGVTMWP